MTSTQNELQLDLYELHYRAGDADRVGFAHYGQVRGDCNHRHRTPAAAAKCVTDGKIVIQVKYALRTAYNPT